MARAARFKVYRTPIGFHDADVAAPSQKTALAAWGSAHDLLATGEAELVTDPSLTKAPLATPGKIVCRVRGTTAEYIGPPPSKPDHSAVDAAEAALAAALERQGQERQVPVERGQELRHEQQALETLHKAAAASLRKTIRAAGAAYVKALAQ